MFTIFLPIILTMSQYQVVDNNGNVVSGTTDNESLAHEIAGILTVDGNVEVEVVEVEVENNGICN